MYPLQVLQLLARAAHDANTSTRAEALHATMRRAVQSILDEGTHEAAPKLLQTLLRFASEPLGGDVADNHSLAAALHVAATLLQVDEACRATAVGSDGGILHIALRLCTQGLSERCMSAALEVLHAIVCAARDYQCTAMCQQTLQAGVCGTYATRAPLHRHH